MPVKVAACSSQENDAAPGNGSSVYRRRSAARGANPNEVTSLPVWPVTVSVQVCW